MVWIDNGYVDCPHCSDEDYSLRSDDETCSVCNGKGWYDIGNRYNHDQTECGNCDGTGTVKPDTKSVITAEHIELARAILKSNSRLG